MQLITMIQGAVSTVRDEDDGILANVDRFRIGAYSLALLFLFVYLLPLHGGVMTSIKTVDAFARTLPMAPPSMDALTFDPWVAAAETLGPSMINSFMFTIPAMVLSTVLGSFAAFGLTMVNWRGQVALMAFFVAATFLPKQAIVVPLSRFWTIVDVHAILANLGPLNVWELSFMKDHYSVIIELIITHTAYGISICTLLFRGFYLTIDDDLIEAAQLDGAGLFAIYRNIILPLSYPMFAVVAIFQFTQIWNEFFYGLVISSGAQAAPVTVALNDLNSGYAQFYNRQTAGAFIVAIPTLIVYFLFGDKFAEGVKY